MSVCPRLTELTVIAPNPDDAQLTETGILLDTAGMTRPAISELAATCGALPDFDTLQIVRFPITSPRLVCWCGREGCGSHAPSLKQWERALKEQTKDLGERAVDCLKRPETARQEGERRTVVRVIRFSSDYHSVKVEECEV